MEMNITLNGSDNHKYKFDIDTLHAAADAGAKHVLAHVDSQVLTQAGTPKASQQIYAALGLHDKNIKLHEALSGSRLNSASVEEQQVVGRLATPAYLFDAIENHLRESDYGIQGVFNSKAAQIDSINNTKFDRPIINYHLPEQPRSQAISQLSEPTRMLLLTVSDKSYKIPGSSIGIEYSDQVEKAFTLPIVTMSITRQAEVERMERIEGELLDFLYGNEDLDVPPLSAVPGAVTNATSYDPSLSAGELSQDAWVKWIFSGSRKRRVDTVITDFAGALAIENRKGRPTAVDVNGYDRRVNVDVSIANPTWPTDVSIIVSQDPNWPSGVIVGFDHRFGYHIVNSTVLTYQAMEEYMIRRSKKLRFDWGAVSYRLFDDAWQVLQLS